MCIATLLGLLEPQALQGDFYFYFISTHAPKGSLWFLILDVVAGVGGVLRIRREGSEELLTPLFLDRVQRHRATASRTV